VPPDYLLRGGDELVLTLWGSMDADLRLQVDRSGRITIPRVGPIMVSGVRYADLADVISRRVGQVFKNFQLSVSLGQLRGMRVYTTGFVQRPGSVLVNSLATLAQALARAGGPSASGSYRSIQLRRGNATVAQFDLYDLLLKGDRSGDVRLETDDVIHVGPIGPQVALLGSVNRTAIFEIKPGESVDDVLRMAGGFSAVGESGRLALERLGVADSERLTQLDLDAGQRPSLKNGDVLRAFNAANVVRSIVLQNKRVRIDGEVVKPGEYLMPASSSLADVFKAAGGISAKAYVYATEFTRASVQATQAKNYERALRDLESQFSTVANTRRVASPEEALQQTAANASSTRVISQLRELKPTGRIVLPLLPESSALPEMALEDGDRIYVPARPNTVGVFGSVFSSGSFLHADHRALDSYLQLAGGPTRGADASSIFVVRANGAVVSSLQSAGMFTRGNQIAALPIHPGDTIFVPVEFDKTTWVQDLKDWTQILYQLGIGTAGIKSAFR
jgi:polysaccharide biosynthesis/export protein